ncbi:hypothetical protein SPLC1_S010610 [Arthrospira platensis C1]|nr:hypothetical protein SPLC1_S010610 [Arthrospira platensis C1]
MINHHPGRVELNRSVYRCLGIVEVQIGVKGLNAIAFLP